MFPIADARTPGEEVSHELKRTMIEIGTPVCSSLGELRDHLVRLRSEVAAAAESCGLAIMAAGTHPITGTVDDDITDEPDYADLADRYAHLAHEQNVCGCHVHVSISDRELAITAMNHVRPWLPVLLALSASSPFWDGTDTGYASYRTEIFGRWPTAGPPEPFIDRADYDEVVAQLLASDSIDTPSRIYWDARPSVRYETLEVRVADVCTSLDDAVLVAGLTAAIVRWGVAAAIAGEALPVVRPELLRAARWRAARFGLSGDLVDVFDRRSRPASEVLERLLDTARPELERWGEGDRITQLLDATIARGTSADRQRAVHARRGSADDVVAWLLHETAAVR